jgi:hypothetical protein
MSLTYRERAAKCEKRQNTWKPIHRTTIATRKLGRRMEARIGFEPMNRGFADRCVSQLRHRAETFMITQGPYRKKNRAIAVGCNRPFRVQF